MDFCLTGVGERFTEKGAMKDWEDYISQVLKVSEQIQTERKKPEKAVEEIVEDTELPIVEYKSVPMRDSHHAVSVMKRLHRMTAQEIKDELKKVHLEYRGPRSQIYNRLKKYCQEEYTVVKSSEPFSNRFFFRYFVVIDFECTCEDGIIEYPHEIIEFPAILVDAMKREVVDIFHSYVRPVINPNLSEFCTKLTGITQEMVDNALPFTYVLDLFRRWMQSHRLGCGESRYAIVTDGSWDMSRFFQMQCIYSGIGKVPHDLRYYVNIRRTFIVRYRKIDMPKVSLLTMLNDIGLEFEGRVHSGLDDSKNIVRILLKMLEDGCEIRINERIIRAYNGKQMDDKKVRVSWTALPYRIIHVSRAEFLGGSYLDCDSCDEC